MAVELLVKNGHRRLGLMHTFASGFNRCNHLRKQGIIQVARELGLSDPPEIILCNAPAMVYEPLGTLIHRGVTAIVCSGEIFSPAISYALTIFGHRIPDDLSVIGYEFNGVSCYCLPQQTTLRQNFEELGEQALNLLEQLSNGHRPAGDIIIPYQLLERATVGPARKK